jgi:lysophospholipase L1-like esterase
MGPVLAMRTAQRPPAPEQVSAAQNGTTIGMPAQQGAPVGATAQASAQANAAVEPMGQAKLMFDYTHVGPEGADLFAAIVADELARAVPPLRGQLIP